MLQPESVNTPKREVVKGIFNYNFYLPLNLRRPLFKVINRGNFTKTIIGCTGISRTKT